MKQYFYLFVVITTDQNGTDAITWHSANLYPTLEALVAGLLGKEFEDLFIAFAAEAADGEGVYNTDLLEEGDAGAVAFAEKLKSYVKEIDITAGGGVLREFSEAYAYGHVKKLYVAD